MSNIISNKAKLGKDIIFAKNVIIEDKVIIEIKTVDAIIGLNLPTGVHVEVKL